MLYVAYNSSIYRKIANKKAINDTKWVVVVRAFEEFEKNTEVHIII